MKKFFLIIITITKIIHKQIYKTEDNLPSNWTESIGKAVYDFLKLSLEDLDPRMHLINECKSEKDKQHLSHLSTVAKYVSDLSEKREARLL